MKTHFPQSLRTHPRALVQETVGLAFRPDFGPQIAQPSEGAGLWWGSTAIRPCQSFHTGGAAAVHLPPLRVQPAARVEHHRLPLGGPGDAPIHGPPRGPAQPVRPIGWPAGTGHCGVGEDCQGKCNSFSFVRRRKARWKQEFSACTKQGGEKRIFSSVERCTQCTSYGVQLRCLSDSETVQKKNCAACPRWDWLWCCVFWYEFPLAHGAGGAGPRPGTAHWRRRRRRRNTGSSAASLPGRRTARPAAPGRPVP